MFYFHLSKHNKQDSFFNSVILLLFQATVPLELPQVKPKRSDDSKGLGMQLKGPLGLGGRGPLSELRSSSAGCPGSLAKDSPRPDPSGGSQKPTAPPQTAADHLEEELDMLLNLDAPVKEGDNILPDQTSQDLKSEREGQMAQEEEGMTYILFPIHSLDSGVFVRTAPPTSHPYTALSVSDIDPALSLTSIPVLTSLLPPELTFLTTFLSLDTLSF